MHRYIQHSLFSEGSLISRGGLRSHQPFLQSCLCPQSSDQGHPTGCLFSEPLLQFSTEPSVLEGGALVHSTLSWGNPSWGAGSTSLCLRFRVSLSQHFSPKPEILLFFLPLTLLLHSLCLILPLLPSFCLSVCLRLCLWALSLPHSPPPPTHTHTRV